MKNLILTMCLLMVVSFTYAQLHVVKEQSDAQGNIITQNGAVGIGTNVPTEMLEVKGDLNVIGEPRDSNPRKFDAILKIGKNRPKSGYAGVQLFSEKPDVVTTDFYTNLEGGKYVSTFTHNGSGHFQLRTGGSTSDIRFVTYSDPGVPKIKMFIKPGNGNVGIGNSDPQYKLHVSGTAAKEGDDGWVVLSDKRTKKNVNTFELGLDEVLELNPVTFSYNGKAGTNDSGKSYVGLIAQEFAEIMPNAVSKYSHTDTISNKTEEFMAINASSVRYMLVNAVQEQQALIEAQKAELETLKTEMVELKANSSVTNPTENEISVQLEGTGTEKALLAQNSPNPFTTTTRIEYFIPTDSRHCRMSFRDMNGKELKQVNIEHDGIGAIELSSKDLSAGIYSYVLYVNGNIVASKKMILKQ